MNTNFLRNALYRRMGGVNHNHIRLALFLLAVLVSTLTSNGGAESGGSGGLG